MRSHSVVQLHPALRGFPGGVVELSSDGVVVASNGRLERSLGRDVVGTPFVDLLEETSRRKWGRLLAEAPAEGEGAVWELMLDGAAAPRLLAFQAVREGAGGDARLWLVETPRDPRVERLHEELMALTSDQANTQRLLAKEKARLNQAMDELERELSENQRLARLLQEQNEEMETQNEELLALTEEMHVGQEELLHLNQQLEKRSRELQLALSVRNRFYASMSHELRTPINAVMGYNDLLLSSIYGALTEQQELAVERSQSAARHLRDLVNDVLDISRLELGKVELESKEVRVAGLVEELFVTLRPLADAVGAQLFLHAGDCPAVVTDPRRVRQILMNLLSNALKYGNGKPVWVRCGISSDGAVMVEVTDGGEGIAPEDRHRIFEEFVQLGKDGFASPASREGTGLGLPISRRLANLLGGRLEVDSTPGVGSTFRLVLPTRRPNA